MRYVAIALALLVVLLQVRLWLGDGSVPQVLKINEALAEQKAIVDELSKRNQMQDAEVQDLKHQLAALEERARNDIGMIKEGETFFQYNHKLEKSMPPLVEAPPKDEIKSKTKLAISTTVDKPVSKAVAKVSSNTNNSNTNVIPNAKTNDVRDE